MTVGEARSWWPTTSPCPRSKRGQGGTSSARAGQYHRRRPFLKHRRWKRRSGSSEDSLPAAPAVMKLIQPASASSDAAELYTVHMGVGFTLHRGAADAESFVRRTPLLPKYCKQAPCQCATVPWCQAVLDWQ